MYASCWKQWLRASFWLWGSQSVILVLCLVIEQTDNYKQAHPGSTVYPRLHWAELVSLPQVRYICQITLYVEKHQNFGPEIVWKSRGLFRVLGYNELVIYMYRG